MIIYCENVVELFQILFDDVKFFSVPLLCKKLVEIKIFIFFLPLVLTVLHAAKTTPSFLQLCHRHTGLTTKYCIKVL